MTAGLAVGVSVAVAAACAAGAYIYSHHHFESLIATARETALSQGELIRTALEHQMMENDRSLISRMIEGFGKQAGVDNVLLLDRSGRVQYSSRPESVGSRMAISSPTCQSCHGQPREKRSSSRVLETREGALLRTVIPIRNREACHRCHEARHSINGVLIVDVDAGSIRTAMNRDISWMLAGTGLLALVLTGTIGGVVRLVVIGRLKRFETTARLIAAGDFERRVPAAGFDTIDWLAREFNSMADSLGNLVSEVRQQGERLETVINSIDDGIVVLDAERKVIAANEAFLQRTGRYRSAVLGVSCLNSTAGMCNTTDCPALSCLQSGARQVRIHERRTVRGEVAWEEVHASPIRGASGSVQYVVEVWRDISARRAAEAQLAESHRLASLGFLAAGFSHELNTPLATTLACVEGILRDAQPARRDTAGWDRVSESAAIARDQLLRCRGVTQNFLRLSSGKGSPGNMVDVEPALAAVARLVEPTARAQGVTVTVEPVEVNVRVRVNEAGLQHVLLNLLLNAIQASSRGSGISISVEDGDPVAIRVTDSGCGIPPEIKEKLFEPFCSSREGGTGLGLFLSLNFIRRWGGDIKVQGRPEGGSVFEVLLPSVTGTLPEVAPS
ncbi:MAG: PAS domain S-box protein [Acidobacteria bacterium]|nr:PAS domain S-box protein [Acidobacteriota bacterium]